MSTTLVTGPVRSGKSRHAEHLLALHEGVLYVATGPVRPDDPEWAARVRAHRESRPTRWTTLETLDVAGAIEGTDRAVLVDCLGTWLTGLVDSVGWEDLDAAAELVTRARSRLVDVLRHTRHPVVVVTNEVGWSLVPTTPSGRFFADELGRLNAAVSSVVDHVHLVVAGRVVDLSGAPVVPKAPPPRTLDA